MTEIPVEVDDCASGETYEDLAAVPCGDPDARWRVVGQEFVRSPVLDFNEIEALCERHVRTTNVGWEDLGNGQVMVLCLERLP